MSLHTRRALPAPSVWLPLKLPPACHRLLQGLTKLLGDSAPGCMKEQKFENYFGRKIAVDASMHIYSFLVRIVGRGGAGVRGP